MSYRSPRSRDMRDSRNISRYGRGNIGGNDERKKYYRPGVSQDEISELKEAFDLFDTEKTGAIEIEELKHTMNSLSFERKNKMVYQILDKLDGPQFKNKDRITFEEFLDLMTARIHDKDSKEEIMKVFELFDYDGKGHITLEDLKNICFELGEELSEQELKEMIDRADLDGKGYVNAEEFYNIMTKKTFP